ncbi:MAG: leucyl aminopeptidase family protein [Phycisphaerales bacterium]
MFKKITAGRPSNPVRVFPVPADGKIPAPWKAIPAIAEAVRTPGFKGKVGETLAAGPRAVLLGIGDPALLTPTAARKAGAKLVSALDRMGHTEVSIEPLAEATGSLSATAFGRGLGEGLAVGNWRLEGFAGEASERAPAKGSLRVGSPDAAMAAGLAEGLAVGECVNFTRTLQATPPNVAHPQWIAAEAKRLAKSHKLKVRVIDFAEAKRLGMGGLATVGMASAHKPCLIELQYAPAKAAKAPHLAIVGKTLTYDTGGYSLKVNNGMKGMKYDKSGGCAVLGAIRAIAEAKLPIRVTALLPTAENMVAGDAFRPDDVITLMNGVTCEVTNTDAEGRLVLADALCWACERVRPDAIVDLATLTGGVVTALGNHCAGYFCETPDLARRLEEAANASGERLWRLPLWDDHRALMRSRAADIVNSGAKRGAHPIQGAAFLSFFVKPGVPWAHIDIAGVSDDEGHEIYESGPTGFGTMLVLELAKGFAADAAVTSRARGRGRR